MSPSLLENRIPVFAGGIDRDSSELELANGRIYDALNVLPRNLPGVRVVRGKTAVGTAQGSACVDMMSFGYSAGTLGIIARMSASYKDLLGGSFPSGVDWYDVALHSLSTFRRTLLVAQQGKTLQMVDPDNNTVIDLTDAPKAGLAGEYMGRVVAGADNTKDDSSPAVTVPLYGISLPIPGLSYDSTGTGTVVYNPSAGTSQLTADSGTPFAAVVAGRMIIIGTGVYTVKTKDADDKVTVYSVNDQPASEAGVAWSLIAVAAGNPLVVYPSVGPSSGAVTFGTCFMFTDSGALVFRIFNRMPTAVQIIDIKPQGKEFRISEMPNLPATIPPGGSVGFQVIAAPQSEGVCSGSIIIQHNLYSQGSLTVPVEVTGTLREVLASPSCLDFGAHMKGQASAALPVTVKNPLTDGVVINKTGEGSTGPSSPFSSSDFPPANEVSLAAEKEQKYTFTFTAPTTAGGSAGSFVFKRYIPVKPFRWWLSKGGDGTRWNRDRDWVDLIADGASAGMPRACMAHDDAFIVWKEADIWYIEWTGDFWRPVQIPSGKGIGALSPWAIDSGAGRVFFASKEGVQVMVGKEVSNLMRGSVLSQWLEITQTYYSQIRLKYYNGMVWVTDPYHNLVWVYDLLTEGWWKISDIPTAFCASVGLNQLETLYGMIGQQLYKLDNATNGTDSWYIETGYMKFGSDQDKWLWDLQAFVDDPALISAISVKTESGAWVNALLETVWQTSAAIHVSGMGLLINQTGTATATYDSGTGKSTITKATGSDFPTTGLVGRSIVFDGATYVISDNGDGSYVKVTAVAGAPASVTAKNYELLTGDLDFSNLVMTANEVQGKTMKISGTSYTVTSNTTTKITFTHTLKTGFYAFEVYTSTLPSVQIRRAVYPEAGSGTAFKFKISGTKPAASNGDLEQLFIRFALVAARPKNG